MPTLPVRCTMASITALRGSAATTQTLVARRAGGHLHGIWTYIAGHVAQGETGWQAALRELREETALVPEALYATSFCEQFYSVEADCIEIVPAFVARVADDADVRLNEEHTTFRWLALDDAAALLPFGSQRALLAFVRREFVERRPSQSLRVAID